MKVNGKKADFALVREEGGRIIISYGLKKISNALYEWHEVVRYKKQVNNLNMEVVKSSIIEDINNRVRVKIVGGFVWNDKPVWLSEENQVNFAQAIAPVRLKIGEQEDGTSVYHDFETQEEVQSFFNECILWRQQVLSEGWSEKDAMTWEDYQELFPSTTGGE